MNFSVWNDMIEVCTDLFSFRIYTDELEAESWNSSLLHERVCNAVSHRAAR